MATVYMARSAWTSAPRGGAQLTGTKLLGLAVHWPGTTQDSFGVQSAATVAARLRGYWDFHVNTRGWSDIGYNFAIDQAGRVWDLRGLTRVGAHAASDANPDANHEWLGVLFILGDREPPTAAMIRAFQDFRHDVFLPRWPGRTRLTGHGRAPGVPGAQTSCPGPYAAAKITDGTLAQSPGTTTPEEDMPITQDDANLVARTLLNYPTGGEGSKGVGPILFGEMWPRIRDYVDSRSSENLAITRAVKLDTTALRSENVDVAALAAALAPLLSVLTPEQQVALAQTIAAQVNDTVTHAVNISVTQD